MAINQKKITMDGNEAAAYVAYAFSELSGIYPITPSSAMADIIDQWSNQNKKNIFNTVPKLIAFSIASINSCLQSTYPE